MIKRNNLVEFARFLFSVLVIGYHVQMSFSGDGIDLFENGALAVEFFFLISGYFFARSIEKLKNKYLRQIEIYLLLEYFSLLLLYTIILSNCFDNGKRS